MKSFVVKLLPIIFVLNLFASQTITNYLPSMALGKVAYAQLYEPDYSYTEKWKIKDFHSEITLSKKDAVQFKETITADFANEQHHGIARVIPFEYTLNEFNTYNAEINFINATDSYGDSWDTTTYTSGGYLNIEMVTQDYSYLTKVADFIVEYSMGNVIGFFDEKKAAEQNTFPHDEFFWNVNGTDWPVKTDKVSATVKLPALIPEADLKVDCFTGKFGESLKNCSWKINGDTINFETTQPLNEYENLSILIGMPVGTIAPTPAYVKTIRILSEVKGLFLAPIILILMIFLWYKQGRSEPTTRTTVIPHYKPPRGMLPAETGTLIDESLDPNDITSTLIDYAVKGYIKITELETKGFLSTKKDYQFDILKPYKDATKTEFEKLILDGIFGTKTTVKLSELNNKFYTEVPKIQKSVMDKMIKDGYFPHNPSTVRAVYNGIGVTLLIILLFFSAPFLLLLSGWSYVGLLIGTIIILIFAQFMGKKTEKGNETYYELRGLFEYINTADKDRIKFYEKNNLMFEKLLPYAMAFGISQKWAKAFEGLITQPPSWFNSNTPWGVGHPFSMVYLSDSLSSITSSANNFMISKPSSSGSRGSWSSSSGSWGGSSGFSGGGFSGGGFGGGGGRGL